jgi:uncharacterized membrane protein YjjP (DUF1212 family)
MTEPPAADAQLLRRCLLHLGAALLAGGRSVHDTELELQLVGTALGAPAVQVAAAPTGVFVTLGPGSSAAFQQVGPALRFDQLDEVERLPDALVDGRITAQQAVTRIDEILQRPSRVPVWVSAPALVLVGAGIALFLQPATSSIVVSALGAGVTSTLMVLSGRSTLLRTLLPIVAAFLVAVGVLLLGEAGLVEGPLRTMLGSIAVLLPGSLLVTGMSELAAGAMVAGSSRLTYGLVQLLLFTLGVLGAARVVGVGPDALANVRAAELGWWAPWLGVLLVGIGVCYNVSAPRGALPWVWLVLLLTLGAQLGGQAVQGAPLGGLLGGIVAAFVATVVQRIASGPPLMVVFLPSFWLLVPGSLGLLGTTRLAVAPGDGARVAVAAVVVIVAIALGVLVGSTFGRAAERLLDRRRRLALDI